MPNTTNFSLPYPQSSDSVDVPRDISALASAVDTKLLQTVRVFATTTARDTAITSPTAGMICYVDSGDANEGLYTYHGSAWRKGPGWAAPWGIVNVTYATTIDSASLTTEKVMITSASFTAVANRYYRIHYFEPDIFINATANITSRIRRGTDTSGTLLQQASFDYATNDNMSSFTTIVTTLAAGSATIVATLQVSTGGTQVTRSSSSQGYLLVEDIGPSGAPA